jgi:hypothetical protein
MRAKEFMMREEITIMADSTVDESKNPLIELRTGGLPLEDDKNHLVDLVKDLDIGTRQPLSWPVGQRIMDRALMRHRGTRMGEAR